MYIDIVYIAGLRTDLTPLCKPRAVCAAPFFGCAFRRFACATWRMSNALFALPRDAFAWQPDKHDKGNVQIQSSRQVGEQMVGGGGAKLKQKCGNNYCNEFVAKSDTAQGTQPATVSQVSTPPLLGSP